MKKKEVATGRIEKTVFPDKGYILREEGMVEVKQAIPGQVVEYRIAKKHGNRARGTILRVLSPSPLEDAPNPCPHRGECGGCLYQSVGYEHQLKLKEEQVLRILEEAVGNGDEQAEKGSRFAGSFVWEGIHPSPSPFGYRNKMEYSFGDAFKGGPLTLGLHKRGSHYDIVKTEDCRIVDKDFNRILSHTLDFFSSRHVSYHHKLTHEGLLRHLLIRKSRGRRELLIDLIIFGEPPLELVSHWKDSLLLLEKKGLLENSIAGILVTRNDSPADVVIDEGTRILWGRDYIIEELLGCSFKITPFSFFQTNSSGAEVLYQAAGRYLGETRDKVVFDLYSGTGTIAQILASYAKRVYGVEIVEEAVEAARENARINNIGNCIFLTGDVLQVVDTLEVKPDIIVLDPPREGIHPRALPKIIEFGAEKIVYISCKPSSLGRDLIPLQEAGYRLERACAVDMFPHTANVECIALLQRVKS